MSNEPQTLSNADRLARLFPGMPIVADGRSWNGSRLASGRVVTSPTVEVSGDGGLITDNWHDAYLVGGWPVESDAGGYYVRLGEDTGITAVTMPVGVLQGIASTVYAYDLFIVTGHEAIAIYRHPRAGRRVERAIDVPLPMILPFRDPDSLLTVVRFQSITFTATILPDGTRLRLPTGDGDRKWQCADESDEVSDLPTLFDAAFGKPKAPLVSTPMDTSEHELLPGGLVRRHELTTFVSQPEADLGLLLVGLVSACADSGHIVVLDYEGDLPYWWSAMGLRSPDDSWCSYVADPPAVDEVVLPDEAALIVVHSMTALCQREGVDPRSPVVARYVETMRRTAERHGPAVVFSDRPRSWQAPKVGAGHRSKDNRSHVSWWLEWQEPVRLGDGDGSVGSWVLELNHDASGNLPATRQVTASVNGSRFDVRF